MNLKLIEKELTNNRIEELFEELGFVEGEIKFVHLQNKKYVEKKTDSYIFFDDMIGVDKYVIFCNFSNVLDSGLVNAMSGISLENNIMNFYSFTNDSSEPYFSIHANYFSLYSLGEVDWETINILEIVKEIERTEG